MTEVLSQCYHLSSCPHLPQAVQSRLDAPASLFDRMSIERGEEATRKLLPAAPVADCAREASGSGRGGALRPPQAEQHEISTELRETLEVKVLDGARRPGGWPASS